MPRAVREEVRVVKRVLLARRGRFLLAFLDGGPSAIFRVKHRDASTSARPLARAANVEKSVVRAISGFTCYVQRLQLHFARTYRIFARVSRGEESERESRTWSSAIDFPRAAAATSRDKPLIRLKCFYDMRASRRFIYLLICRDIRVNCKNFPPSYIIVNLRYNDLANC